MLVNCDLSLLSTFGSALLFFLGWFWGFWVSSVAIRVWISGFTLLGLGWLWISCLFERFQAV